MTMFSHSRLSTFEQCKLKYKFKYIDKVEAPVQQTIEAFLGSVVHATLEKLYKDLRFEKLNTIEELLEWYNREWKKNWNEKIIIVRNEYTEENYRKMGERFIRDYYRRYYPFKEGKTIALEQKVKIRLDPEGKYIMRGVIDRLSCREDGVYEIHDYKTNFTLPFKEYLKEDRQLALYAIAVKNSYPDADKIRLVWHFLAHDKEVVMEKTDEELEKLKKETIELIETIKNEKDFRPKASKLCDWCEFRSLCPLWSHISKTEKLEPNEYLKDPGVKLVNRYAELKLKREEFLRKIDAELEKLKEAIIKFSEKEGCEIIAGSDVAVRVWKAEIPKFPGKNEEERKRLEEEIKNSGRWDEVSMLDTAALSRIIQSEAWPEHVLEKIRKFVRTERIEKLYLKRLEKPNSDS